MPHKMRIIGISGQAGSGKDTLADHLCDRYFYTKVALADPIKRFGYHVFLFNVDQLWGPSERRNKVDVRYHEPEEWDGALGRLKAYGPEFCTSLLGNDDPEKINPMLISLARWFFWLQSEYTGNLSPRIMLQALGTEWGRDAVHEDLWINAMLNQAKSLLHEDGATQTFEYDPLVGCLPRKHAMCASGVVVSDIRFKNEFEAIHRTGGAVVRVIRPDSDADAATLGIDGHASEAQEFDIDDFDFIIQNNSSLSSLLDNMNEYMTIFKRQHRG